MIYIAAKPGIADLLAAAPKSIDEIVNSTVINTQVLLRIMRGFVLCGLVNHKEDKRFELTPLGEYLLSDLSGSLKEEALFSREILSPAWSEIYNTVKTGTTGFNHFFGVGVFQYLTQHPEVEEIFTNIMVKRTVAMSESILSAYDFSPFRKVVDIGGGFGALLVPILKKNLGIHGVLFDTPSVIQGATKLFEKKGSPERCTFITGDFFDSVPRSGDLYILKSIIHDWDDAHSLRILKNCHKVMGKMETLLLIEWIIPDLVGNATHSVHLDLTMLMVSGGQERTEKEYRILLDSAGFQLNRIISTHSGENLIECIPKQK